ncbi:MAG: SDR family NAD(P)-dependent oxidoreductase, partial [Amphiplicatus sp.]
AGSGIGRALALDLAAKNAALALSDIDEAGLAETAARLNGGSSNRLRTDRLDVSDPLAIEAYAARIRESLGPADYLFNVAGLSRIGRLRNSPLASFERVMDVNFWSVARMTKAFLPQLLETKGGIVNLSSVFGLVAVPGQAHYCASKFAVRGFSEAIAAELKADGVRVTCVHPGGVATNIARNAEIDALPEGFATKDDVPRRFKRIAITSADQAAERIVKGAAKGARRVVIGADARLLSFLQRLFPTRYAVFVEAMSGKNGH